MSALRRDPAHTVGAYGDLGLVEALPVGTAACDIGTVAVKTAEDVWAVATGGTVTSRTDAEIASAWWTFDVDPETSSLSVDFDRSRPYDVTADTEPGLIFRVGDRRGLEAFEVEEGLLHGVSSIVLPIATDSPVARVLFAPSAGWSYIRYGARCECHPDHPYSVDINAHLR